MAAPPTGTVTFLFTDIEGSTRMWEREATAMRAALARHDEILKEAIETNGGFVFKTMGDAFCAAFDVRGIAIHTSNLGATAVVTGEFERAEALLQEAREMLWNLGDWLQLSLIDITLGNLALARNDFDLAEKHCLKVILDLQERAEVNGIDGALDILASVTASRGEIRRAARIWGGVEGYRDARDIPWAPDEREMIEPRIDAACTRLDEAAWEEEWERGKSMTLDQTVGYALEGVGDRAMEQG